MDRWRHLIGAGALVASVAGLGAHTVSAAPSGAPGAAIVRWAVPGVAQSLDPRTANEFQQVFLEQVYEPLLRTAPDGDVEPGLAIEWHLVDDGDAFELILREGVTFHDGEPFDADAVAANLDAAIQPDSGLAAELDVVESVEVVDDHTVRLLLNGPGGHLTGVLSGYAGMMISPAALDDDLQREPVGAGPFVLTEFGETAVTFEAWDGYYAADDVTIAGIEFSTYADQSTRLRALQSGQLDGAFLSSNQAEEAEAGGLEVAALFQTSVHGVLLNTAHVALGSDEVRQALMRAIDRDAISEVLYDGRCEPTVQPYPDGFWAHVPGLSDSDSATYDVDAARALMAEAGYPDGFSVVMSSNSVSVYPRLAEVLQQQFAEIGIEVTVEVQTDLTAQRRSGDFDMVVGPFQAGRADPTNWLADHYATEGRRNFGGVVFDGVSEQIAASRSHTDTAERSEATVAIVRQSVEQGPTLVPVCHPAATTAIVAGGEAPVGSLRGNWDFRHVRLPD